MKDKQFVLEPKGWDESKREIQRIATLDYYTCMNFLKIPSTPEGMQAFLLARMDLMAQMMSYLAVTQGYDQAFFSNLPTLLFSRVAMLNQMIEMSEERAKWNQEHGILAELREFALNVKIDRQKIRQEIANELRDKPNQDIK